MIYIVVLLMALPLMLIIPLMRGSGSVRPAMILFCAVVILIAAALPTLLYIGDLARMFFGR